MRRYFRKPHRKPGRRSKPISLLSGEIDLVRKAGGPTFTPLSGGRFRCNQLPYKGRLTREQVIGIREACAFRGSKPEKEKDRVVVCVRTQHSGLRHPPRVAVSVRESYDYRSAGSPTGRRIVLPEQGSQGWLAAATGHRTAPVTRW
jgi:hypothetical protein